MKRRALIEKMEKAWGSNAGERIAFIPDLRILGFLTPAECVDIFNKDWGAEKHPPCICLPLVGVDGVAFDNKVSPPISVSVKLSPTKAEERTLGQIARDFADLGCGIYLYVCPAMQFLQVESCHVLDIRNMGNPQACVHKERTQDLAKYMIAMGIDHVAEHLDQPTETIKGVVIDITDLWGMGGENGKLSLTCFCDECRDYFANKGISVADFENYPNPWNLALKDSGTGISYIDNISHGETPSSIVGKSALRGFDEPFETENEKIKAASRLMQYMKVRHEMVEDFLTSVFQECCVTTEEDKTTQFRRIVVVEGTEYDWTSGVFPGSLKPTVLDEIWLDPSDKMPHIPIPHKTFMWRRATYHLTAFFQMLSDAGDRRIRATTGLGRLNLGAMKAMLQRRGSQALNNELRGIGQLAALPSIDTSTRSGIVGVVFTEGIVDDLLRNPEIAAGVESGSSDSLDAGALMQLLGQMQAHQGEEDED